mgnify:CR=1 FL=1
MLGPDWVQPGGIVADNPCTIFFSGTRLLAKAVPGGHWANVLVLQQLHQTPYPAPMSASKKDFSRSSTPPSPPASHHSDSKPSMTAAIDDLIKRNRYSPNAPPNGTSLLPPFLNRKVSFRDATHSESMRGLVATRGSEPTGSAYVGYNQQRKRPASSDTDINDPLFAKVDLFPERMIAPFLKWKNIAAIGPGLSNLGNTCFLNSVLQSLLYTTPLAEYLRAREHSKRCSADVKAGDFCGFCVLERQFHQHLDAIKSHASNSVRPHELVARIKSIAKHFRPGRQEDAHEFLRYLLESLQKACLRGCQDDMDGRSRETTVLHRIFGGYLQSTVICATCKHASRTFDPFLDLSLEVKQCDSIDAALKLFVQPEILTRGNRYRCEACHRLTDAQKQFTVYKAPEILTIQLKRFHVNPFTGQPGKIGRPVSFPATLDFGPVMSAGRERPQYSLYAVIVHEGGSCNSGHYHAFVKNSSGIWYSMNDCSVHQVSLASVLQQRAYILFYQRDHSAVDGAPATPIAAPPLEKKAKRSQEEIMNAVRSASQADSMRPKSAVTFKTQPNAEASIDEAPMLIKVADASTKQSLTRQNSGHVQAKNGWRVTSLINK